MSSILSVLQINTYISFKLKNDPKLKGVAIKGEISNLSVNQKSGHIYFTLKDESSSIKAVMFYSKVVNLNFMPMSGQEVVVFGNIDLYDRDGVYQIVANEILPIGEGSGEIALSKLKNELEAMGVFSAPKKEINRYPKKIAIVTSPTGAALQDIINIISRRYPITTLVIFPTLVQGVNAPEMIVSMLNKADSSGCDTIILARGGGASEDLAAFNTREVTLAVYNCKTPVISAIGHETDWTLSDYSSDLRAPTPSGAAELATCDMLESVSEIKSLLNRLDSDVKNRIRYLTLSLDSLNSSLELYSPKSKIENLCRELNDIDKSLDESLNRKFNLSSNELESLTKILESYNPELIFKRGYAGVMIDDKKLSSVEDLKIGQITTITLPDGRIKAVITEINFDGENFNE